MLKELANLSYQMLQLHGHVIDVDAYRVEAGAGRCLPPAQRRRHAQGDRPTARPHHDGAELVALAMIWGSACLLLLVSASALFTPFEI